MGWGCHPLFEKMVTFSGSDGVIKVNLRPGFYNRVHAPRVMNIFFKGLNLEKCGKNLYNGLSNG
jgi:hypothetical protein